MNEIVERVAKAIHEAAPEDNWSGWDELTDADISSGDPGRDTRRKQARAAIAALREPTGEMIEAAWASSLAEDAKGTWQDMIEVALR